MWSAEYWELFASELTYGSGLASVWIASGEAAGSTTLAVVGWLQYLTRNSPSYPSPSPAGPVGQLASGLPEAQVPCRRNEPGPGLIGLLGARRWPPGQRGPWSGHLSHAESLSRHLAGTGSQVVSPRSTRGDYATPARTSRPAGRRARSRTGTGW